MKTALAWFGVLAIGAAAMTGLPNAVWAQGTPPAAQSTGGGFPSQPGAPEYGVNPTEDVTAAPSEPQPGTELPVLYVTSVEILRSRTQPALDIVRVTGFTGAQGWSSPELVPTYIGKPLDGILDLQFIATMPLQTEPATGFVPISAVFPLEEGHDFRGVRVRASENAIEVDQIPGVQVQRIAINDCHDCVGKKFVERGQAASGAAAVVRQEDLPKTVRWIPATRGIRGITHNPNRLNLLLGADNTIIAAYWE
jgi:hypothetical protein